MTDNVLTDLPSRVREDQIKLVKAVAKKMGVSVSAVVRWALDDARASLLSRACLEANDFPQANQVITDEAA